MLKPHSRAPWALGECLYGEYDETEEVFGQAQGYLITDADGYHVAIVCGADLSYTERTEGAANARLLTLAPALLALLHESRTGISDAWEARRERILARIAGTM